MSAGREVAEITAYLHRHIPVSGQMGVAVRQCDQAGVVLTAPLAPNLNHRATVFGGSASAVSILTGWTWLHFALRANGLNCRVVIQRNTMDYLTPIDGDFTAECAGVSPGVWEKFLKTLRRHSRARLTLTADLKLKGTRVAGFSGDYVAMIMD